MAKKYTHTFALCAYKESPFMEECLKSLVNQTVKTRVLIFTSTPNDFIFDMAKKYGVEVVVHNDGGCAQKDFNYALRYFKTGYMTLCHQDDVYEPDYAAKILRATRKGNPIILFTDYFEIRDDVRVYSNSVLNIKRYLNVIYRFFSGSRVMRRLNLATSNTICCPSVTFNMDKCRGFQFSLKYNNSFDWDGWIRLSRKRGRFIYVDEPLMGHRIHGDTITSDAIANNTRYNDDLDIYKKSWPEPIAKFIMKLYASGMDSNTL